MTDSFTITIDTAGKIEGIAGAFTEQLSEQGTATKVRASHVLPASFAKRQLFRLLRWLTGEQGAISDWTRRWPCSWQVQIVDGPHLGVFSQRPAAIAAEVSWIEQHRFSQE